MQQRLASLLDVPIAFAHRGARAHAPENTLASFELALKLGANGLESDVWLTSDGVAVLDHDGLISRGWGRSRAIGDTRRSDLPEHVPSLAELLERCGTGYQLSLDLKDPEAGQAVIDAVAAVDTAMLPRLWLCAPGWQTMQHLVGQGAKLVDSTRLKHLREGPERRAATLAAEGIDAINLHHTDWSGGLVTLFHRFGVAAFAWDLQDPPLLRNIMRMGIDGVYSDHVDRMIDAYVAEIGTISPR